jgi:hypothetical protein
MLATFAEALVTVSGSKLTWGAAAIVASLGSRYIITELTPAQQQIVRSPLFKRAAIFCMLFLPTRDILLSACLAVAVSALLEHFLNENSVWCVLPKSTTTPVAEGGEQQQTPQRPPPQQQQQQTSVPRDPLPTASRVPLMGPAAIFRHRHASHAVAGA